MISAYVYLWGGLLVAILVPLVLIDLKFQILPDNLNLLLSIFGFLQSYFLEAPEAVESLLGSFLAGLVMFVVAKAYKKVRKLEGLGLGDVKLAAAGGLWVGWTMVGMMIFLGAFSAAVFVFMRSWKFGKIDRNERIPFGPFLAFGILCSWVLRHSSYLWG